jgi:RNA polymerase sigma-32 factor
MAGRQPSDDGFTRFLSRVQTYPRLERKDEHDLARRFRAGDKAAGDQLVLSNLRYVVKIAGQYRGYGLRPADLVEEGTLGLLEASRRYDPERGLRFMTYAAWWVRAYMLSFVLKQWSIVGTGTGPLQSRMFFRLSRERDKIAAELGEPGSPAGAAQFDMDDALAGRFGTSVERVRSMGARLGQRDVSLDAPAHRDGETTGVEAMVDDSAVPADETVARAQHLAQVRARLDKALAGLDARERLIVERRLMAEHDEATLAELGAILGLSRERVRQLEERVKAKLRKALKMLQAA